MKKIVFYASMTAILCTVLHSKTVAQSQGKPSFNHFALYVVDLTKSTTFYKEVVGLDTIPEPFKDGRHTWFRIGEHSQLHIIQGAREVSPHDMNTHMCFSVASVEDFVARLNKLNIKYTSARGVPQTITTRTDGVRQIYFQDPDNYWVEINDDKY